MCCLASQNHPLPVPLVTFCSKSYQHFNAHAPHWTLYLVKLRLEHKELVQEKDYTSISINIYKTILNSSLLQCEKLSIFSCMCHALLIIKTDVKLQILEQRLAKATSQQFLAAPIFVQLHHVYFVKGQK